MSEFFSGITFPWQKVTPSDDASVRRSVLADGILSGCEISYIGSTLTMGAGLLIGCGRQFRHTAVQNFAVTGASSGYARLVITIDTTKASTKDAFDQIGTAIEYATALDGFTQLRQDDINEAGTVYQMQICVVSLGAGGISGIVSQMESADKYVSKSRVVNDFTIEEEGFVADARALKVLNDSKLSMDLLWENASPASAFVSQTVLTTSSTNGYDLFLVGVRNSVDSDTVVNFIAKRGFTTTLSMPDGITTTLCRRFLHINSGGNVQFQSAIYSTNTYESKYCIPLYVYGIKGVSA